jgi:alpha-glucosidase
MKGGLTLAVLGLVLAGLAQTPPPPQRSRRSQRVRMEQVQVASPDGRLKFTLLPNAERLTFTVTAAERPVLDSSTVAMIVDGYDLSTGVVLGTVERYESRETYPWHGVKSTAVSESNGARISLTHDLTFTNYVVEVRAFNDGVAYRHIIAGEESASRVPDEYSTFVVPAGSTVWYGGMADGHYEANLLRKDAAEVQPGEWAGTPLTFKLAGGGYASIAEANLVNYSGMGLESDGRRGWIVGLGHRQPLNYPFELRYGREEGKRLGRAAAVAGTITTPWRVVMIGDLNTLVNSTILPNLCPPPDPQLFPAGIKTPWSSGDAPCGAMWTAVRKVSKG